MTTVHENQAPAGSAEQFAERMVGVIDSASLAILVSIGHQTALFDTMAGLPPSEQRELNKLKQPIPGGHGKSDGGHAPQRQGTHPRLEARNAEERNERMDDVRQ